MVPARESLSLTNPTLSPYLTGHLKRYGDFVIDLQSIPAPLEGAIHLPIAYDKAEIDDRQEWKLV